MKRELIISLFALLSTVALACGGTDPTPTPTPTPKPIPTSSRPTTDCQSPTLEISVNGDALEFDKDRLEAAAGTEVVLCFNNVSSVNQPGFYVQLERRTFVLSGAWIFLTTTGSNRETSM